MNSRILFCITLLLSLVCIGAGRNAAQAQVLVGSPFLTGYEGWIDPAPDRGGDWRLSLYNPTLMETSDLVVPGGDPSGTQDTGNFIPTVLIQDDFSTPGTYDLNARMYTSDDDLFGLVFGYQDINNYFRASLRWQTPGNFGGTSGASVQKVVNGVVTQITPMGTGPGFPINDFPNDIFQNIANRQPLDVRVEVDGQNYAVFIAGINNNQPIASGSDPDLAPGKIGIQSWAQQVGPAGTFGTLLRWGTEVETVSVSDGSGTLFSGIFDGSSVLPVQWRPLVMTNSDGVTSEQAQQGGIGSFGVDFRGGWIQQRSNAFDWATTTAPNTDFIGPAIVVDEPGSGNFDDYQMRVRMGARDDDGMGVLVRVQDDDNFYRITFASGPMGATEQRAPQGLSVQKVRNGVWTELLRDNQYIYPFPGLAGQLTPATGLPMFDLSVRAEGNTLQIQVIDHNGNTINYPLITDNDDPILTGTVGFHTWGDEFTYFMPYGGVDGILLRLPLIFDDRFETE